MKRLLTTLALCLVLALAPAAIAESRANYFTHSNLRGIPAFPELRSTRPKRIAEPLPVTSNTLLRLRISPRFSTPKAGEAPK